MKSYYTAPTQKWYFFSCYETLPKGYNVEMSLFHSHMRFYVTQSMVGDKFMRWSECVQLLLPSEKSPLVLATQL